jgi:small subunit ribosomal protein S20
LEDIGKSVTFASRLKEKIKMANHKATKKDVRQVAKRREKNRYQGKTTRNLMRDLRANTDAAAAAETLPSVLSKIDKLAKKTLLEIETELNQKLMALNDSAQISLNLINFIKHINSMDPTDATGIMNYLKDSGLIADITYNRMILFLTHLEAIDARKYCHKDKSKFII